MKKNNKRIFISSLVTVVAAGTIGISVAQASAHSGTRRAHNHIVKETDHYDKDRACAPAYEHSDRSLGDHSESVCVSSDMRGVSGQRPHHKKHYRDAVHKRSWKQYQKAVRGTRMERVIDTEDKFIAYAEAYELHKKGWHDEAREIMRALHLFER